MRIMLTSRFWKNQSWYWNKRYLSRKPLISALIWHPESGRGIILRAWPCHRRQRVKNRPRAHKIQQNILFAARGRGALLMMPRPLSGCQIKVEIKGFQLMYCLFLYYLWFFQNIEKGWRKIFEKILFPRFLKNEEKYEKYFLQPFSIFWKNHE